MWTHLWTFRVLEHSEWSYSFSSLNDHPRPLSTVFCVRFVNCHENLCNEEKEMITNQRGLCLIKSQNFCKQVSFSFQNVDGKRVWWVSMYSISIDILYVSIQNRTNFQWLPQKKTYRVSVAKIKLYAFKSHFT